MTVEIALVSLFSLSLWPGVVVVRWDLTGEYLGEENLGSSPGCLRLASFPLPTGNTAQRFSLRTAGRSIGL
jgi:hypothetical protein